MTTAAEKSGIALTWRLIWDTLRCACSCCQWQYDPPRTRWQDTVFYDHTWRSTLWSHRPTDPTCSENVAAHRNMLKSEVCFLQRKQASSRRTSGQCFLLSIKCGMQWRCAHKHNMGMLQANSRSSTIWSSNLPLWECNTCLAPWNSLQHPGTNTVQRKQC